MQLTRPAIAADPRLFGRRACAAAGEPPEAGQSSMGQDLRLFATTFAAGFLFVFVLIA